MEPTFNEGFNQITNDRFVSNTTISSKTVSNLKAAWYLRTPLPVSSQPLIHNGLLFFTDWSGYSYCSYPQDGKIIWMTKLYNAPNPANNKGLPVAPYYWQGLAATGVGMKLIC